MGDEKPYNAALSKAMAICAARENCMSDIRKKLESWKLPVDDIDRITAILLSEKFIDEHRYALAFVKDRFRYNKWGKIKISTALRQKNIPEELINQALESIDNESYINVIRSLIMTHRKSVRAKNQYDLKGKLLRYGLSKGFESHILYDILNDLD